MGADINVSELVVCAKFIFVNIFWRQSTTDKSC